MSNKPIIRTFFCLGCLMQFETNVSIVESQKSQFTKLNYSPQLLILARVVHDSDDGSPPKENKS
jgi:hypothetical protein